MTRAATACRPKVCLSGAAIKVQPVYTATTVHMLHTHKEINTHVCFCRNRTNSMQILAVPRQWQAEGERAAQQRWIAIDAPGLRRAAHPCQTLT